MTIIILDCACGRSPLLFQPGNWPGARVECVDSECWRGPMLPNAASAIEAWNRVMARALSPEEWFKEAKPWPT